MVKNKEIRLNLGSGRDYIKDWVNVDVDTQNKVDVVADLNNRFPFEDDSVDEIKASDILEHFTKEDGGKFLKESHRVLKSGGVISIRTHNIYQIFEQFRNDPQVLAHFLYGDTAGFGSFGSHKYAYTKEELTHILKRIGYKVISFNLEETNFFVLAQKVSPIISDLNIGIIMQSPDIGGAEVFMLSLINNFLKKGNRVFLASNSGKFLDQVKKTRVKIYEIPTVMDIIGDHRGLLKTALMLPFSLIYYLKLLYRLKKEGVDVILMSNYTEKLFVTLLSPLFNIPVVWIEYGSLEAVFKRNFGIPKILYRIVKNIPKKIIVPSRNTMKSLIGDARVSLSKLELVPLGVEISKSASKSLEIKTKDNFIIGSVSRLAREKGQDYLIKAMPMVLEQIPSARLLIIGDGPDKIYYKNLISSLKLDKKIIMIGFVDKLDSYYESMDIFVFPSVWELEGFGLVLPEAMFHKLPIVASNIGPINEIIADEESGLLANPKDEKDLAHKIIKLAKDTGLRKELGNNGYKRALEQYALGKSANQIFDILYDATIS